MPQSATLDRVHDQSLIQAINRVQAIIKFELDGTIITANENFLNTVGYSLEEIQGQHHRMFCDEIFVKSVAYKRFWEKLRGGQFDSGVYKRVGKGGREVWISASYNPVLDEQGNPVAVVKFASDITAQKVEHAESSGKIDAISKSQAVIEFELDGTIITANENFLGATGYSLDEIKGQHHRMFCSPELAGSQEYAEFWQSLNRGEFQSGEYKRFGKGGSEIWINASYNPILDATGRPRKVVKFATDITQQKLHAAETLGKMAAISKAQAIIEFNLDGTIITANDNFCRALGYTLEQIQGQHHRMFCDAELAASAEYQEFWEALNRGEFQSGEYKRIGKRGREIWINASYNPILDAEGRPFKVVKFATDITQQKLDAAENTGKMKALDLVQARVEFKPDGTVVAGNKNFLQTFGYDLHEVRGEHHRMFCDPEYVSSIEYREFWDRLSRGENDQGLYQRRHKDGSLVWLRASYNPILDDNGEVIKVVKFATDVTDTVDLREKISETSETLAAAAEELTATSQQMRSNADDNCSQSRVVSSAAEQVDKNIQTVASSTEEMSASIGAIANNVSRASDVANSAVEVAERTNTTISELGESSLEIGSVIKVITSIAQQTNLLALNATIEAARAGEAGKGFAVVANEVKELAKETAKATEDIGQRIVAIQEDTKGAVEAIGEITRIISTINGIQNDISIAIEEQTKTTNEISSSVSEAARGSNEIAQTIVSVAHAAESTSEGASETLESANGVASTAAKLQGLVDKFAV